MKDKKYIRAYEIACQKIGIKDIVADYEPRREWIIKAVKQIVKASSIKEVRSFIYWWPWDDRSQIDKFIKSIKSYLRKKG